MLLFVDIRRGGGTSQTEIADEENSSENDQNSDESDKNVDNSGDLSTEGGSSEGASGSGDASESNTNSTGAEGGSEVKANSANDLGVYDDDGVVYWISDTSYYSSSWSGSGTSSRPYLIQSAEDLALLSYKVFSSTSNTYSGKYFQQTCDIDLSSYYWMPIGGHGTTGSSTSYYFAGCYDGGGYAISGLTTYYDSTADDLSYFDWMGVFGVVNGESQSRIKIHDINVESSTINGNEFVGGICGQIRYYVDLYNCTNASDVFGNSLYTGGIAGQIFFHINIYYCCNTGSVLSAHSLTGGIIGEANGYCLIYDCYNIGDITSSAYSVGGILGFLYNVGVSVYNCYNLGDIEGDSGVGGVVGFINYSSNLTTGYDLGIYNCFNTGNVTSVNTGTASVRVGGIVGQNAASEAVISSCYYGNCTIRDYQNTYQKGIGYGSDGTEVEDSEGVTKCVENISTYVKIEGWMTSASLWNSDYAWDFDSVWTINENYNNGYPILRSALLSFAEYDAEGDFWYLLDGYLPQSYSGTDTPDGVDTSATTDAYVVRISSTEFAQVEIYAGTDGDYALVTYNSASSSASAWFVCEPVVWIVGYGESLVRDVTVAVTAKVVTCGYVWAGSATLGWNWGTASVLGMSVESLEDSMGLTLASMGSFEYDSFASSLSQTVVEDSSTTLKSSVAVSSVAEIDALGGAYATQCTDFVAFLLSGGSSTSGYVVAYWTRDLACELTSDSTYGRAFSYDGTYNQGVYVTSDGVLSNATLKTSMGARLSVSL